MIRFVLAAFFVGLQCALAIEIRVPDGWSQVEVPPSSVPYEMPATIRPMIRLGRPGIFGVVDIAEMEVGIPLDEAAKRYARGMPMRGMTVESTSNVSQRGHEARRIRGILTVTVAGSRNSFPVEVFLIMTQECILSVEAVGGDATSTMNEVLSWIDFQSATVPSEASDTKGGEGRSIWEYLGMGIVLVAVVYAILNSTSSRRKKRARHQE